MTWWSCRPCWAMPPWTPPGVTSTPPPRDSGRWCGAIRDRWRCGSISAGRSPDLHWAGEIGPTGPSQCNNRLRNATSPAPTTPLLAGSGSLYGDCVRTDSSEATSRRPVSTVIAPTRRCQANGGSPASFDESTRLLRRRIGGQSRPPLVRASVSLRPRLRTKTRVAWLAGASAHRGGVARRPLVRWC